MPKTVASRHIPTWGLPLYEDWARSFARWCSLHVYLWKNHNFQAAYTWEEGVERCKCRAYLMEETALHYSFDHPPSSRASSFALQQVAALVLQRFKREAMTRVPTYVTAFKPVKQKKKFRWRECNKSHMHMIYPYHLNNTCIKQFQSNVEIWRI